VNVTDRKRIEEARSRSASIVESLPDAIIALDLDGVITAWNKRAQSMFGYTEKQAIGQLITLLVPPELRDEEMLTFRRLPGQPTEQHETRHITKDGKILYTSSIITPLRDAQGKTEGTCQIIRNITDRELAEQALRERDERFQLVMRSVAAGLYTVDINGRVTYINPAAEKMLGWTSAEMLGRKMHDIIHYKHPDGSRFPASDCPALQVLLKGIEINEREEIFVRRDGGFVPVIVSASPLKKQGETIGMVVGFLDDTQRRQANLAMRESEQRFRVVANAAPVMIWMSGTDKLCTYFNEPWLSFTGRSMELELGNGWAEGVHPEDFNMCLNTYVNAFDRCKPFEMEYRLRRHDGEYRWVLDHGVPRFNVDGSFAGYIGSCYDVSERKSAVEALSNVSRRLIEAHEEERAWIARELHDDFNQRIALLKVKVDRMKENYSGANVNVRQGLEEVSGIISDLGSDIQTLSHRLHSSKLEYLGIEAAAASFCKELSQQHNVRITFRSRHLPTKLPREISLCLFRVLQEGLQNAVKHSGAPRMEVQLEHKSAEIRLTVQDTGTGFDPEAAVRKHGLGLTSMRERLKLVGGQLSVESNPRQGTTIQATIPLHANTKFASTAG
jgi:PAS domain S-box-containing protein